MKIIVSDLFFIRKEKLANGLFFTAMILAFFASIRVWFLIPIYKFFPIIVSFLLLGALAVSRTMDKPIFNEKKYLLPAMSFGMLFIYQAMVNGLNVNAYLTAIFNIYIFVMLFMYDKSRLFRLSTIIAKVLGCILAISIPSFFLYLVGAPLPNSNLQYNDGFYYFSNYYLFLVDERNLLAIFPRFQSVFLEPTYLGSTTALLLQTQRGHWKKWYNLLLLAGLLLSFSLAGYAYLIAIIFLNMWIKGKKIFKALFLTITTIATIIIGSFFYNDGDNLLQNMILLRLEVNDGELEGNNRISDNFEREYEDFLNSDKILFGEDFDNTIFGNSGYQVYFFDYGVTGILLLFLSYGLTFTNAPNKRAMISAFILFLLVWGVDGFVLWYSRFIPLYITAFRNNTEENIDNIQETT